MNEKAKERISQIGDFVFSRLYEMAEHRDEPWIDPDYRWKHTLRVTEYGRRLAEAEGANVEQVVAACLLHDVAHFDDPEHYRDHGRLGAKISRPFLTELGYSQEDVDAICFAIAVHVDDKADFEHPETIEAEIVSDADNIDRFGAYRILQFCCDEIKDFDKLIEKVTERLPTLQEYRQKRLMGTDSGHELFNQQLDRQIDFFQTLLNENKISELPS